MVTRDAAVEYFGLADRLSVIQVFAGTPAEKAGMEVGDLIVAINGEPLPVVGSKREHQAAVKKVGEHLNNTPRPVSFRVLRGDDLISYTIAPEALCGYPVHLVNNNDLNAYADGQAIYITTGMMRFTENDQELQAVIAHELAHNTEGHVAKKRSNAAIGGIFGALIDIAAATQGVRTNTTDTFMQAGASAFSQDFEREADYVGVYMLQRADIDTANVANIWRRMAAESPSAISFASSHPTTAERFINLKQAHEEATFKRLNKLPLEPEEK